MLRLWRFLREEGGKFEREKKTKTCARFVLLSKERLFAFPTACGFDISNSSNVISTSIFASNVDNATLDEQNPPLLQ